MTKGASNKKRQRQAEQALHVVETLRRPDARLCRVDCVKGAVATTAALESYGIRAEPVCVALHFGHEPGVEIGGDFSGRHGWYEDDSRLLGHMFHGHVVAWCPDLVIDVMGATTAGTIIDPTFDQFDGMEQFPVLVFPNVGPLPDDGMTICQLEIAAQDLVVGYRFLAEPARYAWRDGRPQHEIDAGDDAARRLLTALGR